MGQAIRSSIGRFRVESLLAGGPLASVYLAYDPQLDRRVALKVISSYFANEPELLAQFLREVEAVRQLRHPSIVPVHELGVDGEHRWLAMEYMTGGSLKERLTAPLPLKEAIRIIEVLADALDEAHARGILHKDIKPSNVLFSSTGRPFISDFGMAILGDGVHPLMKTSLSTPLPTYTSYEQAMGLPLNRPTDVYSLAVLAYEMLTTQVPFYAIEPVALSLKQSSEKPISPSQHNYQVPTEVDQVILTGLRPFVDGRYPTAGEFARQLRAAAERAVAPAVRPEVKGPTTEAQRRRPLGGRLMCQNCGQPNSPENVYCSQCWSRLDMAPQVKEEEATALVEQRRLRVRRRKIATLAVGSSLLALSIGVATFLTINENKPLPPASSAISSISQEGEWAMYQRNPDHISYVTTDVKGFAGKVKWSFKTQEPIFASPAYVNGVVFFASGDRRIVALDGTTGRVIWETKTTGPIDSSPAVAGEIVYVGLRDGRVLALEAATGNLAWQYETRNPVYASPLIKDGVAYVASGDGNLYGLDAAKGTLRFAYPTGGWILSSPAISQGILATGSSGGSMTFIDIAKGKKRLEYRVGYSISGTPLIVGDIVYFGSEDGTIRALDLKETTPFWEQAYLRLKLQLYIWGLTDPPRPQTGFLWASKIKGAIYTGLGYGDGKLFAGTDRSVLYAVDATTGKELWNFKGGRSFYAAPVVAGDTVLAASLDNKLYAVDTKNGQLRWTFTAADRITASPIVAGKTIFLTSHDGTLYALE